MYKCLRNHPSPQSPFFFPGDPYLSVHIFRDIFKVPPKPFSLLSCGGNPTYLCIFFRDIFKVKASFDASQGSFWGRKFSDITPGPG